MTPSNQQDTDNRASTDAQNSQTSGTKWDQNRFREMLDELAILWPTPFTPADQKTTARMIRLVGQMIDALHLANGHLLDCWTDSAEGGQ